MRTVTLIRVGLLIASLMIDASARAQATKKKPTPLTDAERKQLVGVLATLDLVEARLLREMALDQPAFERHMPKALALVRKLGGDLMPGNPPCPPGTCPDDGVCIICEPPRCNAITFNGDLRMLKTNLLSGPIGEPVYRANAKKALAMTQELVKLVTGTEPLTASGFSPANGILMPSAPPRP